MNFQEVFHFIVFFSQNLGAQFRINAITKLEPWPLLENPSAQWICVLGRNQYNKKESYLKWDAKFMGSQIFFFGCLGTYCKESLKMMNRMNRSILCTSYALQVGPCITFGSINLLKQELWKNTRYFKSFKDFQGLFQQHIQGNIMYKDAAGSRGSSPTSPEPCKLQSPNFEHFSRTIKWTWKKIPSLFGLDLIFFLTFQWYGVRPPKATNFSYSHF